MKLPKYPRNVILFRDDGSDRVRDEMTAAKDAGFVVVTKRSDLQREDQVIGRYSVLPYYRELVADLPTGAKLVNSPTEHDYVANVLEYYNDLRTVTPKTWPSLADVPADEPGPFVLKGVTNSFKFQWATHMYAANRKAASVVLDRLMDDTLIGQQQIVVRRYVPLKQFTTGLRGLPITREFRVFVLDGQIIAKGYYWASHVDELVAAGVPPKSLDSTAIPRKFLYDAIARVQGRCRFFAMDVAEKADGGWVVVELNDGQMSGLSTISPWAFYTQLANKMIDMFGNV